MKKLNKILHNSITTMAWLTVTAMFVTLMVLCYVTVVYLLNSV